MTRVVVTGMGTVNPLGNDVVEFKENLFAGKLGIAPITKFDASETGITNAGEVKNFDPTLRVGKKAAKRTWGEDHEVTDLRHAGRGFPAAGLQPLPRRRRRG